MKQTIQRSIILLTLALLTACGTVSHHPALESEATVLKRLQAHYQEWKATPYRIGGESKRAIDCSAFVQKTFGIQFNIELPRSTELQAKEGTRIDEDELRVGDLVFFKTGWNVRHVGIYMGQREFMHASTSKGVTISSLDNPYWQDKFWKAIRI